MVTLYLKHRETQEEFKVVKHDKEKNEVTLQGKFAAFTQPFDKEAFKKWGYDLVKRDE